MTHEYSCLNPSPFNVLRLNLAPVFMARILTTTTTFLAFAASFGFCFNSSRRKDDLDSCFEDVVRARSLVSLVILAKAF
eukprot:Awhi_evm1s12816